MKTCFRCSEAKPLAGFYAHPQMKDGHLNKCKVCTIADSRKRAQSTPGAGRLKKLSLARRHPLKQRAYWTFDNALRSGALVRPPMCSLPDCQNDSPEGHHVDYAQPLAVVWLCAEHHRQTHELTKQLRKAP